MTPSQPADPDDADAQDRLTDALVQAAFLTMAVLNRVGAENELSLTQLRVLGILRDRRLRITSLADFLGLEKSTLTGLVARAEKRGLLSRAPSAADGRAVEVFLSPEGRELGDRLYADIRRSLSRMTSGLSPGERRRLQGLVERMVHDGTSR